MKTKKEKVFGAFIAHAPSKKLEQLVRNLADKYFVSWVIVGALATNCNNEEELELKVEAWKENDRVSAVEEIISRYF